MLTEKTKTIYLEELQDIVNRLDNFSNTGNVKLERLLDKSYLRILDAKQYIEKYKGDEE